MKMPPKRPLPPSPKWPGATGRSSLPSAGPVYFILAMLFVFVVATILGFFVACYFMSLFAFEVIEIMLWNHSSILFLLAPVIFGLGCGFYYTRMAYRAWRNANRSVHDAGDEDFT